MLAWRGGIVTTESVVSEIVAGTSTRTSFFILMVASSVSFTFSDFSTALSAPLSSHLFVSLVSSAGDSTVAFIRGPVPVPPSLRLRSSYPRYCRFFLLLLRLDSFLLSWRERLNSLRPLFAPDSLSSFLGLVLLVTTSRPSTAETVGNTYFALVFGT